MPLTLVVIPAHLKEYMIVSNEWLSRLSCRLKQIPPVCMQLKIGWVFLFSLGLFIKTSTETKLQSGLN